MLEKIGTNEVYVKDYTNNFDIKDYIHGKLIPEAFPDTDINKLNLGYTGITSEMISSAIEDAFATASLMINESFITRAILPSSIYANASLFNLGYSFAIPTRCSFALQLWEEDVIKYSSQVYGSTVYQYKLDKDTKVLLGSTTYKLDYDIIIDSQIISGKRVYNTYYDMSNENSISKTTNKYITHQTTSIGWLVLVVQLQEFDRKVVENSITDNLITSNSDITLRWSGQIAGIDLVYISPEGERIPMIIKVQHSVAEQTPFVWYVFDTDYTMRLIFNASNSYWKPDFNSKIESTIYTCHGASKNFDSYDSKTGVSVKKSSSIYPYNSSTKMVALCYGASTGGIDKSGIELLRSEVVNAYNTANVLTTDSDLLKWFETYAKRYGTKCYFFKRRDDPSGRLFSQFIAIIEDSYVYPTNTLEILVNQSEFDFVNVSDSNTEFIIKPGHLWEYVGDSRTQVRMVDIGSTTMPMVYDETLPSITDNRPFMFTNPFYIKISKNPSIVVNYNYLIDHTSFPENVEINTDVFYNFQLATFSIQRTLSSNRYDISIICVPVVTSDASITYVEHLVDSDDGDYKKNNLRVIMTTKSDMYGSTGYIEMYPTEHRAGGAVLYETSIWVDDNVTDELTISVDKDLTEGINSLITTGDDQGKIILDIGETSFEFAVIMNDFEEVSTGSIYNNESFNGYVVTNVFKNDPRQLDLYTPMNMMRSTLTFDGSDGNYDVTASLIPFLKYDIVSNEDKMLYFVRAFNDQYTAMQPVLDKLDGNTNIDFKLYNTYGRSNNYYIGPDENVESLWDSNIQLDNVYVRIRLRLSVYDRSLYSQTCSSVISDIIDFFDSLDAGDIVDVHVSDIIHMIKDNHDNVNYIRFVGFNDYDARKQSIFIKHDLVDTLSESNLRYYVPEMIRVDEDSIEIMEEV